LKKLKKLLKRKPLDRASVGLLNRALLARSISEWKGNLDGCLRFLEGIPYQENIHGRKWVDKMVAYYGKKADDLLARPPRGCKPVVSHYKRRLRQLRANLYTRR